MPVSAWLMLIFGCVVLYGGFAWCLKIALSNRSASISDESEEGDDSRFADLSK